MQHFEQSLTLPVPVSQLFDWHARPGAFQRMVPPFDPVRPVSLYDVLEDGARAELRVKLGPLALLWVADHDGVEQDVGFTDTQTRGPFATWVHRHAFEAIDANSSKLTDRIRFQLPLAPLSTLVAGRGVAARLRTVFDYRHRVLAGDVRAQAAQAHWSNRRVLVTGSGGVLSEALAAYLSTAGHEILELTPGAPRPAPCDLDEALSRGVDAWVHVEAGAPPVSGSAAPTSWEVAQALRAAPRPPTMITLSVEPVADRAQVEAVHAAACRGERRAALLRLAPLLDPRLASFGRLVQSYAFGLGPRSVSATETLRWLTIDDAVGLVHAALAAADVEGELELAAPSSSSSEDFARCLGHVLRRPRLGPSGLGAALHGSLSTSAAFASPPAELTHDFRHPELEGALRHVLGR